jgi:predicted phage terminase large subunit-like protein
MLFDRRLLKQLTGVEADVDAARMLRDLEAHDYEDSLYNFMKAGWRYIDPNPFVDSWHLEAIALHLQAVCDGEITRLIINQPPRTSKSSMLVAFDPWVWAQRHSADTSGPGVQFLHTSYAQTLSVRDSVKTRRLMESPWYQHYWGDRVQITSDQNTKVRFDNAQGGYRLATSVGGTLTGEGGSIIVCFPYWQTVQTEKGLQKIGDLVSNRSKDKVLSFDRVSGSFEYQPITGWNINPSRPIYTVRLSNGDFFQCTADHRLMVADGRYLPLSSISIGDQLCGSISPMSRPFFPVAGKPVAISHRLPSLTPAYLLNRSRAYAVSFAQNFCSLIGLGNGYSVFSCQLGSGTVFQNGECSVPFAVGNVVGPASVSQIFKSVIERVSIQMADICVWRSAPNKSKNDQNVDAHVGCFPIVTKGDPVIPLDHTVFQNLLNYWACYSSVLFSDHARQRFDAPVIADNVEWKFRDCPPDFLTVVDIFHSHTPDATYCLTVAKNSNMCIGQSNIIAHNCDDPHNAMEAESETIRRSTLEWFDNSLSTRLNNPRTGAIIVVMQRLHEEDLTGHILASDAGSEWVHLMLPMRYEPQRASILYPNAIGWSDPRTEEGELLTPERYDEASVARLERQLGPYGTAGQLQQRPEPKGGGILKRDWWQDWTSENYPEVEYVLASVDTAYTEKEENDFSAMTVWGVFTDKNDIPQVILMNAWEERLELNDLVVKIAKTAKKFKVDHMLIENKAAGISVAQEIRRIYSHEDWSIQLMDPKGADKIARAYSVQPVLAEGIVHAPMSFMWAEAAISQCASFPKGKHDDIVDTVTMGLKFLRTTGMITRGEERTAQLSEEALFRGNKGDAPLYPV